jgi:hypothetical protein
MKKVGHTVNQDLACVWREMGVDSTMTLSSVDVIVMLSSLKRMVIPLVRST